MAKVKVTFENITITNNGEGSGKENCTGCSRSMEKRLTSAPSVTRERRPMASPLPSGPRTK
jgi:hypothetical protein